jgi:adenylate kinase family enzyme
LQPITGSSLQTQKDTDVRGFLTKPHIYFLLGGPGSGKDTQGENLIRDYKFKHLSTGQLLRMQKEKGGELAKTIDAYMREGKLLPSSLVVDLLEEGIQEGGNRRYLFNGFPRSRENW